MLLRDIDLRYDLCNGTRLLCCGLFKNMLDVEILTGSCWNKLCLTLPFEF